MISNTQIQAFIDKIKQDWKLYGLIALILFPLLLVIIKPEILERA